MKKCCFYIILSIFSFCTKAQQPLDYLSQINKTWLSVDDKNFIQTLKFNIFSNNSPIQQHLYNVIKYLKIRDISHLNKKQHLNRLGLIDILQNYTAKGIFPVNKLHTNLQPYFIDEYGTYCAVGFLMKQSGFDVMAKEINSQQQYHHLENIDHPQLMEWVWQSGFSFDELALVQPYYGGWGTEITELHFNNTGTDVNEYIEIHDVSPGFLGLHFDSVYFYDNNNTLYKTLAKSQMSQLVVDPSFYHYTFPSNENFADMGKVELIYHDALDNRYIVSALEYNNIQIIYTRSGAFGTPITFPISENETTPVSTSLSFCGNPFSSYHPELIPATIGTIQGCLQNIAPIDIINFTHQLDNNQVKLSWEIPDYISASQVSLERSLDGITFQPVANALLPYSQTKFRFIDIHPNYTNHYRIKVISATNEIKYSKLIFVRLNAKNPIIIKQPIVSSGLSVTIQKPIADLKYLHIYTLQGQLVMQPALQSNNFTIPVQHLSSGKYILRLGTHENIVYTTTFIKN